jgi:hypothetical protein
MEVASKKQLQFKMIYNSLTEFAFPQRISIIYPIFISAAGAAPATAVGAPQFGKFLGTTVFVTVTEWMTVVVLRFSLVVLVLVLVGEMVVVPSTFLQTVEGGGVVTLGIVIVV